MVPEAIQRPCLGFSGKVSIASTVRSATWCDLQVTLLATSQLGSRSSAATVRPMNQSMPHLNSTLPRILVAVDGTNLVHRSHHASAASDRRDAAGTPVWALAGVVRMLASSVKEITNLWREPTGIVVCFDGSHDACRRRNLDAGYKATRRDPNPDLDAHLAGVPALLSAAGISVLTVEGQEADDGCASATTVAAAAGWHCVVVTSDRDALAHASGTTRVLRPVNGGGWSAFGPSEIAAKYGLPKDYPGGAGFPAYAAYAALRGDKSDELPGVGGLGNKTAAVVISALAGVGRTVEDAYRGDSVAGGALRERHLKLLLAGQGNYERNRTLMDAVVDLDVDLDVASRPLDEERAGYACGLHGVADVAGLLGGLLGRRTASPADIGT